MILLMVRKSGVHHLGCRTPWKYWDKLPTSSGAGFLPSTVVIHLLNQLNMLTWKFTEILDSLPEALMFQPRFAYCILTILGPPKPIYPYISPNNKIAKSGIWKNTFIEISQPKLTSKPACIATLQTLFFGLTLPETNIFAPENAWLEYDCFLLGWPDPFSGALAVSFREGTYTSNSPYDIASPTSKQSWCPSKINWLLQCLDNMRNAHLAVLDPEKKKVWTAYFPY